MFVVAQGREERRRARYPDQERCIFKLNNSNLRNDYHTPSHLAACLMIALEGCFNDGNNNVLVVLKIQNSEPGFLNKTKLLPRHHLGVPPLLRVKTLIYLPTKNVFIIENQHWE